MYSTKLSFEMWLRDHLAQRDLSGGTLARRLSLPPSTVYDWIHGTSQPDDNAIPDVAEVLGVTIGELRRALMASA